MTVRPVCRPGIGTIREDDADLLYFGIGNHNIHYVYLSGFGITPGGRVNVGIIGNGAIARYVREALATRGHTIAALLLRNPAKAQPAEPGNNIARVASVAELPQGIDRMLDCAGHGALRQHGPGMLRRGIDLVTLSIGALADAALYDELAKAAADGGATLYLASGAIGALDCLRAARAGDLDSVTYIGRKPPIGWKGSAAEHRLDLDALESGAHVHFDGAAGDAAREYPKNANVAAAVALAGLGFEKTRVRLIADADVTENIRDPRPGPPGEPAQLSPCRNERRCDVGPAGPAVSLLRKCRWLPATSGSPTGQ
jgi:aspartate dehydrogenase